MAEVLTFEEARAVVQEHAARLRPGDVESVRLLDAVGRVITERIGADRDFPPFARATRDGYAVRSADLGQIPATIPVVGEIKAGSAFPNKLRAGEAVEIMTGAAVPDGADCVVMVEYTRLDGNNVVIERGASAGENIVPQGAEAQAGASLVEPGTRLDAAAIAVAASVGKAEVQVFRKPRVAIVSTGDELVELDTVPGAHQIRNSNSYSLAAQVTAAGGEAKILPVARDVRADIHANIANGLDADLLILSGGVSMGKYDLVEQVLVEFGAELFFTGAKIQPGKPIVFGRVGDTYFFGLPGNPVSTMVTFELFVRTVLDALRGVAPQPIHFLHARLRSELRQKPGLTRFLPAMLTTNERGDTEVELATWQGSGDVAAVARADCFAVVPAERERIAAGEWIRVLPKS